MRDWTRGLGPRDRVRLRCCSKIVCLAGAANTYHVARTRGVSAARLAPTSGQVVTQIQSGSSRTDSLVRILHAQPASPVSVRHVRAAKIGTTSHKTRRWTSLCQGRQTKTPRTGARGSAACAFGSPLARHFVFELSAERPQNMASLGAAIRARNAAKSMPALAIREIVQYPTPRMLDNASKASCSLALPTMAVRQMMVTGHGRPI